VLRVRLQHDIGKIAAAAEQSAAATEQVCASTAQKLPRLAHEIVDSVCTGQHAENWTDA